MNKFIGHSFISFPFTFVCALESTNQISSTVGTVKILFLAAKLFPKCLTTNVTRCSAHGKKVEKSLTKFFSI